MYIKETDCTYVTGWSWNGRNGGRDRYDVSISTKGRNYDYSSIDPKRDVNIVLDDSTALYKYFTIKNGNKKDIGMIRVSVTLDRRDKDSKPIYDNKIRLIKGMISDRRLCRIVRTCHFALSRHFDPIIHGYLNFITTPVVYAMDMYEDYSDSVGSSMATKALNQAEAAAKKAEAAAEKARKEAAKLRLQVRELKSQIRELKTEVDRYQSTTDKVGDILKNYRTLFDEENKGSLPSQVEALLEKFKTQYENAKESLTASQLALTRAGASEENLAQKIRNITTHRNNVNKFICSMMVKIGQIQAHVARVSDQDLRREVQSLCDEVLEEAEDIEESLNST